MPITYRVDKGSALTYQELDDNFREVAGIPNVRWLKLKDTVGQPLQGVNNLYEAFVSWNNQYHTDETHFNLIDPEQVILVKNGVYRINANIVIEFLNDSTTLDAVKVELLKNDVAFSETNYIPYVEIGQAPLSLTISTIENFEVNDTIKIKVTSNSDTYVIKDNKGEFIIEWIGYNP